ncbi:MAG TPA: ankyrin repeat domain-containing protein [Pyrinomonadaceae bacterium]|nr:ankyrin repeat domain-containing protein [Pyrinomonadaceae bacterium]
MTRYRLVIVLLASVVLSFGCVERTTTPTPEAAQQLLKLRGYEFDEKSFYAAVSARDMMSINAFLDAGINPNAQNATDGRTVLINAAARGDLEVVKVLVQRGADVNVKDKQGYTALFHAIEAMYDDVELVLLSQPGLDPNARGLNGTTALLKYVWRDRKDAVDVLLKRGADVNAQDADGDAPLHGAAENGNVEILNLLLDKGADPNVKNKLGGTPLMWAAVFGNETAAARLLERGADASLKDVEGMTALDWARKNKRDKAVAVLQRAK